MNNELVNMVSTDLVAKWGSEKVIEVIALGAFGAALFVIIGAVFIPNEPMKYENGGE